MNKVFIQVSDTTKVFCDDNGKLLITMQDKTNPECDRVLDADGPALFGCLVELRHRVDESKRRIALQFKMLEALPAILTILRRSETPAQLHSLFKQAEDPHIQQLLSTLIDVAELNPTQPL